jgi:hypothetical protein
MSDVFLRGKKRAATVGKKGDSKREKCFFVNKCANLEGWLLDEFQSSLEH